MHETCEKLTFALSLRHSTCKCFIIPMFYNMSDPRCAQNSSHNDISQLSALPATPTLSALPALPKCLSSSPLLSRRNGRSPLDPPRQPQGARIACETMFCVILQTAHEPLYRGSDIRLLRHYVFLLFSNHLCAKCSNC